MAAIKPPSTMSPIFFSLFHASTVFISISMRDLLLHPALLWWKAKAFAGVEARVTRGKIETPGVQRPCLLSDGSLRNLSPTFGTLDYGQSFWGIWSLVDA